MKKHFCSKTCERANAQCGLCMSQIRKMNDDRARAEQRPTLYATMGDILTRKVLKGGRT